MRLVRGLVGACHPLPTAAVSVFAGLLGAGVGLGPGRVVLFVLAVFAGQLSVGWSNDWIDAGRDVDAGRRDKPAARGVIAPGVLSVASVSAAVVAVGLSLGLGWRSGLVVLVLAGAGWAYNLGLKGTLLSGAAYLVGFGALPAAAYLAVPVTPAWWAVVTSALLGFGAHFANVLPDLAADAQAGIRGLPHRLGQRASIVVMAVALGVASLVVVIGPGRLPIVVGLAGAVVACGLGFLGWRKPGSQVAFRGALGVALFDVVLFLLAA